MMMILRAGQAEKVLQDRVDHRGLKKILAPHHMGNALRGIIKHHRQVVGSAHVAAREDNITNTGQKRLS